MTIADRLMSVDFEYSRDGYNPTQIEWSLSPEEKLVFYSDITSL